MPFFIRNRKSPDFRLTKRMKGFEPSTFCMASRRSSQLSYIRVRPSIARSDGSLTVARGVQRFVHELVGQLVVLTPHGLVADLPDSAGQPACFLE